jgi:hypothetical protein
LSVFVLPKSEKFELYFFDFKLQIFAILALLSQLEFELTNLRVVFVDIFSGSFYLCLEVALLLS